MSTRRCYREGPELYPYEFFAECYTLENGRPSVPPRRMMKLVLLQHWEGLSDRRVLERMTFDLRWKAVLGMEVGEKSVARRGGGYVQPKLSDSTS